MNEWNVECSTTLSQWIIERIVYGEESVHFQQRSKDLKRRKYKLYTSYHKEGEDKILLKIYIILPIPTLYYIYFLTVCIRQSAVSKIECLLAYPQFV